MKYKVLIVDDNINNSKLIEGVLLADVNDYICVFAKDGLEALEVAKQEKPDLILMDFIMPNMDGMQAMRRIRRNPQLKDIPVIIITAYKTNSLFAESFKQGAFDFVSKPIDVNELKSRVYKALGITETLKRIKKKINQYEKELVTLEKQAQITQNAINSFILFNKEGIMEWANEGFVQMHGISISEHKQRHGNSILSLSQDEDIKELIKSKVDSKTPLNFVTQLHNIEAKAKWVQVFVTPQKLNGSDDSFQFLAVETDITELKRKEQMLYEQNLQMLNITENLENANAQLEEQKREIVEQKELIEQEQEKSEKLLLNILPFEVARQLKSKGKAGTRYYKHVSVIFTDFIGFSKHIQGMEPKDLVNILDKYFARYDEITGNHYLEKIKTIGDAYMCAGGLPLRNKSNPVDAVLAGLEIQDFMHHIHTYKQFEDMPKWDVRLGVHTGPVVAGVVGKRKFAYDIWGDTVNIAARMQESGEIGKVNISGTTYEYVKDYFDCEYRGKMDAKNVGKIDMYFVNRIKPELSADERGFTPNDEFISLVNKL